MKKIFSTIVALAVAAFTFTSCEDVPMPYDMPGSQQGAPVAGLGSGVLYQSENLKNWSPVTVKGNAWDLGQTYAKASGYNSATKDYTETDAWLVSPVINTATSEGAYIKFQHVNRYGSDATNPNNHKVFVSSNYAGDVAKATWKQLPYSAKETTTKDWTFYDSEDLQIPEEYLNKEIVIAFEYTCGSSNATTWEIKGLKVMLGAPSAGNPQGPTGNIPTDGAVAKNCADAAAIAMGLADGASTTEVYEITGYITSIAGSVSRNQQSFWMADTKDGGNVFQAYYANLPEGVSEFKVGSKVKIVGNIMRYKETAEIKNANVVILEAGEGGGDKPGDGPSGSNAITINGTEVSMVNAAVEAGTETVTLDLSTLGYANAAEVTTVTFPDGTTATFDKNGETNGPKYYDGTKGVRVYKNNTITFSAAKAIASIVFTCDSYETTAYVGNAEAVVEFNGNTVVYTNKFNGATGGGVQLRVQTITITYAK